MDRIDKFLDKLDAIRRARLLELLQKIRLGDCESLQISKLTGTKYLYKCRQGKIRIVFSRRDNVNSVVNIDFRDKVYRDL